MNRNFRPFVWLMCRTTARSTFSITIVTTGCAIFLWKKKLFDYARGRYFEIAHTHMTIYRWTTFFVRKQWWFVWPTVLRRVSCEHIYVNMFLLMICLVFQHFHLFRERMHCSGSLSIAYLWFLWPSSILLNRLNCFSFQCELSNAGQWFSNDLLLFHNHLAQHLYPNMSDVTQYSHEELYALGKHTKWSYSILVDWYECPVFPAHIDSFSFIRIVCLDSCYAHKIDSMLGRRYD